MANTICWFPQSSNGIPVKCIDNGDGSYSLAVHVVNQNGTTTETITQTLTSTVTFTETFTETKKPKKEK